MRLPHIVRQHLGAIRLVLATMAVAVLFAACGAPGGGGGGPTCPGGTVTDAPGTVKIALLLPITGPGSTQNVAKAIKQAAELALFDFDNPNISLVPKDTKGTPDGARSAAESAVQDGAELIIGPLFAQEVRGAADVARRAGVPMIAFSSDEKVAGNGVFLLSFLAGRDVPRIVSFAMSRGKRNFAVLVPQTAYGRIAEAAFAKAVAAGGGSAPVRATFSERQHVGRGSADRQRRQVGAAGRRAVPARGTRGAAVVGATPRSGRHHQREAAVRRHRPMGLSECRPREGSRRRLVSGAGSEGLEQFRRRATPRPLAARRRASRASAMTR